MWQLHQGLILGIIIQSLNPNYDIKDPYQVINHYYDNNFYLDLTEQSSDLS